MGLRDPRRILEELSLGIYSFAPQPMSETSAGCRRLRSMFMRSKVLEKMMSVELPVSTRIFSMVQPCILGSITNASVWGKLSRFTSSSENTMGI